MVALALLAGLGGKPCGRAGLFVLPAAAWLAGALAGRMAPLSAGIPVLSRGWRPPTFAGRRSVSRLRRGTGKPRLSCPELTGPRRL